MYEACRRSLYASHSGANVRDMAERRREGRVCRFCSILAPCIDRRAECMKITNRKRVLVTGGAGFLGSHLCERLLRDDCDVLCVDNFYSGTKDNIVPLLSHPHFELIRHDVTFPLY